MNYQEYFDSFLASYSSGSVSAESVGKSICEMTQFFINANNDYARKEIIFNKVLSSIEQSEIDGKQLSSSKAKVIAESRDEFSDFIKSKRIIENIDCILKSLKALQQGILSEFRYSSQS